MNLNTKTISILCLATHKLLAKSGSARDPVSKDIKIKQVTAKMYTFLYSQVIGQKVTLQQTVTDANYEMHYNCAIIQGL